MASLEGKRVNADAYVDVILGVRVIESDKTTSIYNVSTRVLSKK